MYLSSARCAFTTPPGGWSAARLCINCLSGRNHFQDVIYGRAHDGLVKLGLRARKNAEEIMEYNTLKELVTEILDMMSDEN